MTIHAAAAMRHLLALEQGFHDVYLVATALALVGALVALLLQPAHDLQQRS